MQLTLCSSPSPNLTPPHHLQLAVSDVWSHCRPRAVRTQHTPPPSETPSPNLRNVGNFPPDIDAPHTPPPAPCQPTKLGLVNQHRIPSKSGSGCGCGCVGVPCKELGVSKDHVSLGVCWCDGETSKSFSPLYWVAGGRTNVQEDGE